MSKMLQDAWEAYDAQVLKPAFAEDDYQFVRIQALMSFYSGAMVAFNSLFGGLGEVSEDVDGVSTCMLDKDDMEEVFVRLAGLRSELYEIRDEALRALGSGDLH